MTAPIVEAPSPIAAGQAQGQSTTDHAIVSAFDPHGKAIARAKAEAARAGCGLYELACGGFLLTRGMHRELPDLRSVHRVLQQMGAR